MMHPIPKSAGFTLIELVVAMVITAILAAIAIPAYSSYVRESRRTDAKSALLDLASLEERYFSVNNTYTATPASLGYTAFPQTVGSGYYQLAAPVITAPTTTAVATYTLTATPLAGTTQAGDTQCGSFTLTSQGVQGITGTGTVSACWN